MSAMKPIFYARHRFPPDVIRHAVWLYLRFTLSYRDVEDLLAEHGLIVSNEAIRRWVLKFGPGIASNLRKSRSQSYTRWHLDEIVVSLSGKQMYNFLFYWCYGATDCVIVSQIISPRLANDET